MRRCLPLLALAFCCSSTATAADGFADAEVGALFNNNLGNAQFRPDIRSDAAATASASAGYVFHIGDASSLTATGTARGEVYSRFSGMSNARLGGSLSLRRKMGLGLTAPWVSLTGSAERLEFQNDVRDGWLYRAGIAAGRRLGERMGVRADFTIERRTADQSIPSEDDAPGSVFRLRNRELAVKADYALTEKATLIGGYTRRIGDVAVTTTLDTGIDAVSNGETRDTVFGPGAVAYKLRASTHIYALGLSWSLSEHSWLNITGQRQLTYGAGDNNYYKSTVSAAYVRSF